MVKKFVPNTIHKRNINNETTTSVITDKHFDSADKAAFAAYTRYEKQYFSLGRDKELSGVIIEAKGRYYFTSPIIRKAVIKYNLTIIDEPTGSKIVAIYHTHPPIIGSSSFSRFDQQGIRNAGIPMYLRNPSGQFRILELNDIGGLGRNVCSNGFQCFSRHPAYRGQ